MALLALVSACLLDGLAVGVPGAVAKDRASANRDTNAKTGKRVLIRERRALMRELRRNPRVILRRSFIRRALAASLGLPLTFRLNPTIDTDPGTPGIQLGTAPSDDVIEFDLGGGPAPTSAPFGQYSGVQDVGIDGKFALTGLFSKDTVALGHSALELGIGAVAMSGEPFSLLDFSPSCSPSADPLLQAGPSTIVDAPPVAPRDHRGGVLEWFTGNISLKLYTQMQFNSLRRGVFDGGGVFSDDCLGSQYWTNAITSVSNPVLPLDMTGHFEISPALTTDGRLRLFTVDFDDAVVPQAALAAVLHSCTEATTSPGSGAAPATTCDGAADDKPLSAAVKVKKLSGEVLIGTA
jgi:hypothetical protein